MRTLSLFGKELQLQSHFCSPTGGSECGLKKYNLYKPLISPLQGGKEQRTKNKVKDTSLSTNEDVELKTWRNDFKIYLSECKNAYRTFIENAPLMAEQAGLNPGINVPLSIEKGFVNFWGTEAGWKNKKATKSVEINWKLTIINSISLNKVNFTKQELANQ